MLAYIDAGTAAVVAAMATSGLAGCKVAAQSFFTNTKKKKKTSAANTTTEAADVAHVAS